MKGTSFTHGFYRTLLTALTMLVLHYSAGAQELMSVKIKNRCVFSGGIMDEELYRYDQKNSVGDWVKEILELGRADMNFELVQTNVENVSAVVDNDRRYLFYSIDFILRSSRIEVYASLAHEIGHHVNNHTLEPINRETEESEADFFMGYILSMKAFTDREIGVTLKGLPSSYGFSDTSRMKTVRAGYSQAEDFLSLRSLKVNDDPRQESLLLPTFAFMDCYSNTNIDRSFFSGLKTMGEVNDKLCRTLDQRGYRSRSYYSVKNGFALVTRMEQFNRDNATSKSEELRWLSHPARESFTDVLSFIKSTIWPNKGYFRLFVFVVTDTPFQSSGVRVSKEEAESWLCRGSNTLPPREIASRPFTAYHTVSALVYEFEVPESNLKANQICPTPYFDTYTHLKAAGIRF